jgi:micrococcal nuclease
MPKSRLSQQYRRYQWLIRLIFLTGLLLVIGLRMGGCHTDKLPSSSAVALPNDDYNRYNNRSFKVVKVLDGDTFDVAVPDLKAEKTQAYTRIRLWGIDTPEIAHPGRNSEMYFGNEAAEFGRKMLIGKMVRLELVAGDTRCRYGRLLAYAWLPDGRMYNELAIQEGYAYADTRYKHARRDQFIALESDARKNLKGLWQGVQPDGLPKWYKKTGLNTFWASREKGKSIPAQEPTTKKHPAVTW